MSKKYNRRRHLKGGFLDSLGQTFSGWGSSLSQGASGFWDKTKKATGMDNSSSSYTPTNSYTPTATPSTSSYTPTSSTSSTTPTTSSSYSYGGRRRIRRKTRKMGKMGKIGKMKRGGYGSNTSLTNLASTGAPFSGQTAKAHNWVGGKKHKRTKSRR